MPGFADMNMVAVGPDGRADPQTQLFRSSALGVETGPFVSQVQCATAFGGSVSCCCAFMYCQPNSAAPVVSHSALTLCRVIVLFEVFRTVLELDGWSGSITRCL